MSKPQSQARNAINFDLFADAARKQKIETLGDPLQVIARHIDFDHLMQVVDALLPTGDATKGGRPAYPSAVMVRILVLKYLYNLSDEQMEYPSAQRSEMLKALGYREHIQRKAKPGKPLSECQKGHNKRIAKTRTRVERPFAQMRHMGGKLIRTIGQARATVAMTMMAACYNLKRLAKFLDDGVDAFYKDCLSKSELRLQGVNA